MEQTIIRLAIGLVLLVAVNVVLGSLNALFDGTFDRIKCRNGVIKGVIIAACFVAFYVAGRLNPILWQSTLTAKRSTWQQPPTWPW